MTPLLAVFAALDIATFWDAAWANFRHLPYSYGLLVAGLVVALTYFIAAALIFPDADDDPTSLDDHFWNHRRAVLGLLILANLMAFAAMVWANTSRVFGMGVIWNYVITMGLYLVLIGAAALSRRRWLVVGALGLHIAIYLALAVLSAIMPPTLVDAQGQINTPDPVERSLS